MKNTYKVHHKRQTLADFLADMHWFHFECDGKYYLASCHNAIFVSFPDESELPEDVMTEVQNKIYNLIDKYENSWRVPKGAQEIADNYCNEEFCS